MAGKKSTLSNTEPAIGGLQVQTSSYGLAIPLVWGRARISGNLLWYGGFKAISHTETTESGGKGGGGVTQERTSYTYEASVILGLCSGPINGVLSAWKGKQRFGGVGVTGSTSTLWYETVVPVGGHVTVPMAADFTANASVHVVDYERPEMGAGTYVEGVHYTVSAGEYVFAPGLVGEPVRIYYQVYDPGASSTSVLGPLGLNLATGTYGQPVWSYLSSAAPSEAIGYSGSAYVYAAHYELTSTAQVENHTFEVSTPSEFSGSIPDADMSRVVTEFLIDGQRGCQWPEALLGDLTDYQTYVRAQGLFMSPQLEEQRDAASILKDWFRFTNASAVWSARQLKIVPLGDTTVTGNGSTYTPNTTPVYDLVPGDFITEGDDPPIRISQRQNEDAYNHVRIEYRNRANAYNVEVVSAKDLAHIEQFGERTQEVIRAHDIKSPDVARFVAQMELQRQMSVWCIYRFRLPWTRGRIEPLDLVTLTDPTLDLDRTPVRVLKVVEVDDDAFDIEAEDAPIGMASAPLYGAQAGSGYAPDYNAAPGNALAPAIFEAPAGWSTTGLALMVATAGADPLWGGCDVWASYDGTNYQRLGTVRGGARFGQLGASVSDVATSGAVVINGGQLLSGTAADAAALATLCYLGGASPEYVAYETATLTSANHYTLASLVRGAHGVAAAAHASGDAFVRVDGAVVSGPPLDPALVGTSIYVKLTSFNVFGGGQQSLADVSAHSYTITGAFLLPDTGNFSLQATGQQFTFDGANLPKPTAQTITFKVSTGGAPGSVTWLATRYDADGVSLGTVTLTGTGSTRSLPVADFDDAAYCVVEVTLGTATDQITVVRTRDGANAISGYLTNESHTVSTASDGSGGSYGGAGGTFKVFNGTTLLTSGVTYSVASSSGITGLSIDSAGVYTLSGTSADLGTATLRAVIGSVTLDKVYTIARSKAGTPGAAGATGPTGATGATGPAGTAGANGANGTRTADVKVYSNPVITGSGAPSISGTSTYTWATGTLDAAPSGWNLTPPTPSAGYTVYAGLVRLSNTNTTSTDAVNWTGAGVSVHSSASLQGGSARTAYAKSSTNPLASTPTSVTVSGYPSSNTWGGGETWSGTVPSLSAGEYQFQIDGIYDPATGNTTWQGPPYQSALKVGSLSAISANLGTITAGTINGITINGTTITGGVLQTATSGKRVILNQSSTNSIRLYDNAGAGEELLLDIGPASYSGNAVGRIGSQSSGNHAIGLSGQSYSSSGLEGVSVIGGGVSGRSTSGAYGVFGNHLGSGPGVYGQSLTGYGGYFIGSGGVSATAGLGPGVYGGSTSGYGIHGFSSTSYSVYSQGLLRCTGAATFDSDVEARGVFRLAPSGTSRGVIYYSSGILLLEAYSTVPVRIASNGANVAHFEAGYGTRIEGKFSCNGVTPPARATVSAAVSVSTPTDTLVNELRAALIACGICQ